MRRVKLIAENTKNAFALIRQKEIALNEIAITIDVDIHPVAYFIARTATPPYPGTLRPSMTVCDDNIIGNGIVLRILHEVNAWRIGACAPRPIRHNIVMNVDI